MQVNEDISMGVSINPTPNPIFLPPCIRTIKMRGCSKIAWMDAIRTTHYPLLSWCFAVILSKEFQVTKIYSGFNQVSYCMQNISLQLFTRLQSRDMNGMSPNPLTWRWQVFFLAKKKKTRNLLFAYVKVHISYKMMHCRNAWRIGTNRPWNKFFGRRFNRKEKIATMSLLAQKIWSNDLFSFVIMQVVLWNICVGQRWNAVMKSHLRVTP